MIVKHGNKYLIRNYSTIRYLY